MRAGLLIALAGALLGAGCYRRVIPTTDGGPPSADSAVAPFDPVIIGGGQQSTTDPNGTGAERFCGSAPAPTLDPSDPRAPLLAWVRANDWPMSVMPNCEVVAPMTSAALVSSFVLPVRGPRLAPGDVFITRARVRFDQCADWIQTAPSVADPAGANGLFSAKINFALQPDVPRLAGRNTVVQVECVQYVYAEALWVRSLATFNLAFER